MFEASQRDALLFAVMVFLTAFGGFLIGYEAGFQEAEMRELQKYYLRDPVERSEP